MNNLSGNHLPATKTSLTSNSCIGAIKAMTLQKCKKSKTHFQSLGSENVVRGLLNSPAVQVKKFQSRKLIVQGTDLGALFDKIEILFQHFDPTLIYLDHIGIPP